MRYTPLALALTVLAACDPPAEENATAPVAPDPPAEAATPDRSAYDNVIHVAAYSHIWHIGAGRDFQLTVTLSIRNPNPWSPLTINRVDYFDSEGRLAHVYLAETRRLRPLETMEVVVEERDETGGSGANFLVGWSGREGLAPPLVEAVMIGTASGQGLSFTSVGRPLPPEPVEAGTAPPP